MICFLNANNGSSVGHYYLEGKEIKLLDHNQPRFGIIKSFVNFKQIEQRNRAGCTFERKNYLIKDKYLNSLNEHFLIAAFGSGNLILFISFQTYFGT